MPRKTKFDLHLQSRYCLFLVKDVFSFFSTFRVSLLSLIHVYFYHPNSFLLVSYLQRRIKNECVFKNCGYSGGGGGCYVPLPPEKNGARAWVNPPLSPGGEQSTMFDSWHMVPLGNMIPARSKRSTKSTTRESGATGWHNKMAQEEILKVSLRDTLYLHHKLDTNPNTIDDAKIKTNMKHIHITIVSTYLNNRQHNKITNTIPLTVHHSETTLPRATRRILVQLRTNKCPLLRSYLNKIDEVKHPSPLCPLCKTEPHTTTHLFSCTNINTQLQVTDLQPAPVEVGHLLVKWMGATSQLAGPDSG